MNDAAQTVRNEYRAWLMANNVSAQEAQDERERRATELAPAPGDDNLTFDAAQAKVCETMTRLDLWGETVIVERRYDETVIDVVRRMAHEIVSDLLDDEYAEFATAVDNGYLQWCERGEHFYDTDDDAERCDDCDEYECAQHGDTEEREYEDKNGVVTATLCARCYARYALPRYDRE